MFVPCCDVPCCDTGRLLAVPGAFKLLLNAARLEAAATISLTCWRGSPCGSCRGSRGLCCDVSWFSSCNLSLHGNEKGVSK